MRLHLSNVTPDLLQNADVIEAIDPAKDWSEQMFGQHSIAKGRFDPTTGPHTIQVVEVIVDSTNEEEIQRLDDLIEEAKPNQRPPKSER